jgi:hypothetical protein
LSENSELFSSSLTELNIRHNSLRRSMQYLTKFFENSPNLRILDLEKTDFDNSELQSLFECIVEHLGLLECLNLSEEMSQQNVWTPACIRDSVLKPLMRSTSTLVFLFLAHREESFNHDLFTTCPLSQNFIKVSLLF